MRLILYQTSEIIHGGETNYIMATVTLYVALYNCSPVCCICWPHSAETIESVGPAGFTAHADGHDPEEPQ